jgi:hypothetical protein
MNETKTTKRGIVNVLKCFLDRVHELELEVVKLKLDVFYLEVEKRITHDRIHELENELQREQKSETK